MGTFIDLTGRRFGRLIAREIVGKTSYGNKIWKCVCDCGNVSSVRSGCLQNRQTKSCGCLQKETQLLLGERVKTRWNNFLGEKFEGWIVSDKLREVFDGLMLGDGGLENFIKTGSTRFQYLGKHKEVSQQYKKIFEEESFEFGPKDPSYIQHKNTTGTLSEEWFIHSHVHPFFTEQYKRWYPEGKKIVLKDLVLTPETVKHWYYGDGGLWYVHHRTDGLNFATHCFFEQHVSFLIDKLLNILNISEGIRSIRRKNGQQIIHVNKSVVLSLLNYIGFCDFPCYQYKWIIDNRSLYDYHKNICPCKNLHIEELL